MKSSSDRILTTHVGSLPRSKAVTDVVFAHEQGNQLENAGHIIRSAVDEVVKRQVASGVDVVSDGEMSKISYATYIKDRITGFEEILTAAHPPILKNIQDFLSARLNPAGRPPIHVLAVSRKSK